MRTIQAALDQLVSAAGTVTSIQPIGGGCISDASRVTVRGADGRESCLFVKQNDEPFLGNFRCESDGLIQLAATQAIGVPTPLSVGVAGGSAWLIAEWIEPGSRGRDFFVRFGRDLAALHRSSLGEEIGLAQDNFLGSAPQRNTPCDDWVEFVADRRIGEQIRWAQRQGLASDSLVRDCDKIISEMGNLLEGRNPQTSLLHGDLWSGNYLCGVEGQPVIIDPAIYRGCREAEFGMLRLFGSCPGEFYDAYQEAFPLPDGCQRRVSVYLLYHLLNHLNLFGSGYLGQSESVAKQILRS